MSDSTDDSDVGDWVFYKDRPEWKDIEPVEQYEGPDPVVFINYHPKFKDIYNYMRAVMKKNELSERALKLTADALDANPANYTVWQYRRNVLRAIKADLRKEWEFISELTADNQKNYQVWHHRMVIVEWLGDATGELEFLAEALREDPKNYHAWKHRQWVITTFKLFDGELDYTTELITQDVRNNSAWNQRYFVMNLTGGLSDKEALSREIQFALGRIAEATLNESAWNYLRGLLIHTDRGLMTAEAVEFTENLFASGNKSPHLLAFLIDRVVEQGDEASLKDVTRARDICQSLAEKYDVIRAKYWNYVASTIPSVEAVESANSN